MKFEAIQKSMFIIEILLIFVASNKHDAKNRFRKIQKFMFNKVHHKVDLFRAVVFIRWEFHAPFVS